jgi:hypothetical protein
VSTACRVLASVSVELSTPTRPVVMIMGQDTPDYAAWRAALVAACASRGGSAAVVVAHRGKNASARSSRRRCPVVATGGSPCNG